MNCVYWFPSGSGSFVLHTDASGLGLGGVLSVSREGVCGGPAPTEGKNTEPKKEEDSCK